MKTNRLLNHSKTEAEALLEYLQTNDGNTDGLPIQLRQRWDRIMDAHQILKQHRSQIKAAPIIVATMGLSYSQAMRLIDEVIYVVGNLPSVEDRKNYKRLIAEEMAIDAMKFAKLCKDGKAVVKAVEIFSKINGLLTPDGDKIDPTKIKQHNNLIVFVQEGGKVDMVSLDDIEKLPEEKRQSLLDHILPAMDVQDIESIIDEESSQTTQP